jgi:plasmid stabilization system protein ParE
MIDTPFLLPEAKQDVASAYAWYENQAFGLGIEFIRCLEAVLFTIQKYPLIYPLVYETYRRALVRRFPYSVFYEVEDGQVIIYGVFHCSQDPNKWKSRLGK